MIQKHKNNTEHSIKLSNANCALLYNPQLLQNPSISLSGLDALHKSASAQRITSGGRGQAWFVEVDGLSGVLRKYMRGGLIARLVQQTYISLSFENTRSVKEWRLLQWMQAQGLPVPQPIAASVCRWPFKLSPLYRAQILVERIPDVQSLDQLLAQRELSAAEWQSVGMCICEFHNAGVYHADLNANNILQDASGKVYLIDFDKGELRNINAKNNAWKQENLQRLKRSLLKQQRINSQYSFTEKNWRSLSDAYKVGSSLL